MKILLGLALFVIDRLVKFYVLSSGNYVTNKGIAFGFLGSYDFSSTVYLLIVMFLLSILWLKFKKSWIPLSFISVGAVSNLIDRLLYNGVVDYIGVWIMPVFNVSDVMIITGALLLIISEIKIYGRRNHSKQG